jgi:hypothetical protein
MVIIRMLLLLLLFCSTIQSHASSNDMSVFESSPVIYKRGLYLGWVGKYNAGDDVVLHEIQQKLVIAAASLDPPISISLYPFLPSFPCEQVAVDITYYDFLVLGGGSILTQDEYRCQLNAARAASLPIFVGGSGWDPRSKFKTSMMDKEMMMPLDDGWLERFQRTESSLGGVRGPLTMRALKQYAPDTKLKIIGDAGLLLLSSDTTRLEEMIPASFVDYLAIGYGDNEGASIYHTNNNHALDSAFASFICTAALDYPLHPIVLYSMDGKSLSTLHKLYLFVIETLKKEDQRTDDDAAAAAANRIIFVPRVLDPNTCTRLFAHAKATINYKLHGSVMSAGVGTPFVALAYHFKSLDFAASLLTVEHGGLSRNGKGYPLNLTIATDDLESDYTLLFPALDYVLDPQNYNVLKETLKHLRGVVSEKWEIATREFVQSSWS